MEITPIQQIDIVLLLLRNDRGHISLEALLKRITAHEVVTKIQYHIMGDVLLRILDKLRRDNFIYEKQRHTGGVDYAITVEGYLFIGYEKQLKIDLVSNRRRNIRDFALTWGTVLAGISATLLLLWQVYSYFHPIQNVC